MRLSPDRFEAERSRLFGLAYRMLGRASEAEEMVQEAWLRVQAVAEPIESLGGLLTTLVTRLCLDRLRSSHAKRETYVGPWLPEPLQTSEPEDRADEALIRAESVSMAFLRILDQLSPMERAVFLLKEVFDYRHEEIARVLDTSADNSRQILRRARQHITDDVPHYEHDPEEQRRVVRAFLDAAASGDPAALLELLHPDVEWTSDGGGVRPSAMRPLVGRKAVLAFALGIWGKAPEGLRLELGRVNESAAVLVHVGDAIDSVIGVDVSEGLIARVWAIRNPEKLRYLADQLAARTASS